MDGLDAVMASLVADGEYLQGQAIAAAASTSWDTKWAATWEADRSLSGNKADYVLSFRTVYIALSEQVRKPAKVGTIPGDIGSTLEDLRSYFEAPDLELPAGVSYLWVHAANHLETGEPFHLLTPAVEPFTLDKPMQVTSRPILACKSLVQSSTLRPVHKNAAWANRQAWFFTGERRHLTVR